MGGRYEEGGKYEEGGRCEEEERYADRRDWNPNMINVRDEGNSRNRTVENRKSIGDRRMERDFGSGLVKNPFDPSTRLENNPTQMNRLNEEEFDLPCMNPTAPETTAVSAGPRGGVQPPTRPTGPGTAPGGADYAALLQYLQFYQNQMGTEDRK
eukprot:GFUD01047696.1.p1 GENE.GFUD01047696.1~~GFUD01047696.1.p1  ORF type:complete len:166 (+),score=59.94 GFUD01047696.1:39-500(+)